jgi:hypothetical protein
MVRLRRSLQALAAGEKVPPLVFRENDYWLESATEFNRVRQLVLGLYKDLDIPDGPQGSEQLAIAANLLHGNLQPNKTNTERPLSKGALDSAVTECPSADMLAQSHSAQESNTSPQSLSLANRVIWQGERNHKPTRYVNHETETPPPATEATEPVEIPVHVSLR